MLKNVDKESWKNGFRWNIVNIYGKFLEHIQRKAIKRMQKKPRFIDFALEIHQNYLND